MTLRSVMGSGPTRTRRPAARSGPAAARAARGRPATGSGPGAGGGLEPRLRLSVSRPGLSRGGPESVRV
jgi:hypothetical protein